MNADFLDSNFKWIAHIDTYISFIWTDKYFLHGDFELVVIPSQELFSILVLAKYVKIKESEHIMIIEYINLHTDIENGEELVIKGRSLESILDRRIIWYPTILKDNIQAGIYTLLFDNIIHPDNPDRDIINFSFMFNNDPYLNTTLIDTQFYGDILYKTISELCINANIGFKIYLIETVFYFKLYVGEDRSYNQLENPYVVFSAEFDNLSNSEYIETSQFEKNTALVAGEKGVGNTRMTTVVYSPNSNHVGLNRKELFKDANDISRNNPNGVLTLEEYIAQLEDRGLQELSKNIYIKSFDGEVDTKQYVYNEDYFMGDILQVSDKYGHSAQFKVIEMTFSKDLSGSRIYPTFMIL